MSVKLTCLIIVIFDFIISSSFTCPSVITSSRLNILQARKQKQSTENEEEKRKGPFSFISETFDMLSNLDDVVDDFYYKRMGKGEVFYGKRKYKPSGAVKGKYSGFGLSDKGKIEETAENKRQWLEEKEMRMEMSELRYGKKDARQSEKKKTKKWF